jgi:hypothetical protein
MAGFLYFLNGFSNPVTDDVIDKAGLRYAFERRPMFAQINGRTPSGRPGSLLADQARLGEATFAYVGDGSQRWEKIPRPTGTPEDVPEVWVGHWTAHAPKPADLGRSRILLGPTIRLARSGSWQVPRLLMHAGDAGFAFNLPSYVDVAPNGDLVPGETVEEYRPAADLAERIFEALKSGSSSAEAVRLSCEVLAINYAVSLFECTKMLQLFRDDDDLCGTIKLAANWSEFERWREKKTAGSVSADSAG